MSEDLQRLQAFYDTIIEFAVNYSLQLVGALIILGAGAFAAARLGGFVERLMIGKDIDVTLSRFTGGSVRMALLGVVLIIALGNLGISVTPLIAAIGAVGLGAGLAIQGMLANYAAGFTIIVTRPFVVGDTVRVLGVAGVVHEVHLGYTILIDEDDVRIQIPNRHIVGEVLHNSAEHMLIELTVGIRYGSDTDRAIAAIAAALTAIETDPPLQPPVVGIDAFGASSIDLGVRLWAPTVRHYEMRYAANAAILGALEQAGIEIPFPQREVRLLGDET